MDKLLKMRVTILVEASCSFDRIVFIRVDKGKSHRNHISMSLIIKHRLLTVSCSVVVDGSAANRNTDSSSTLGLINAGIIDTLWFVVSDADSEYGVILTLSCRRKRWLNWTVTVST